MLNKVRIEDSGRSIGSIEPPQKAKNCLVSSMGDLKSLIRGCEFHRRAAEHSRDLSDLGDSTPRVRRSLAVRIALRL